MTAFDPSGSAWISQGFERLVKRARTAPQDFDVLIVGSGYGGAIAAATFAGMLHKGTATPITVAVLERGREYLPGSFPTGLGELPRHVRREHNKEGLFDIRLGDDVTTVVANGVGGGSLINAGVMEEARDSVFATSWPSNSNTHAKWKPFYDRARGMLGAGEQGKPLNTIELDLPAPQKWESIKAVGGTKFRSAAITVAMSDSTSSGNVKLKKCNRCGDCATGCNFGAKISLDTNLLVKAQQNGAEIFSGATVLDLRKDPGGPGWIVRCVYTSSTLRARDSQPVEIFARRVVLAAGTLGSTEILLRSSALGLPLSAAQLGKRCSTNGDMLITDYATTSDVHTVADGTVKPSARDIGPTITGVIDLRDDPERVLIEEMSVPAGLRLAFTEIFATVNTLHSLAEKDEDPHVKGFPNDDIYAVSAQKIERSALYAVMGDDGAAGTIDLGADPVTDANDGVAQMKWNAVPPFPENPLFDRQVETLEKLTDLASTGGRVIANPVWKLLPQDLQWLLDGKRGPLTTVHPLGGCAMADDGAAGVVNERGEVFSTGNSAAVHDGLVVLDGSVIPTALGTNPALTISAVALRAAEALAADWSFDAAPAAPATPPLERPVYRNTDVAAPPPATQIEFIERLVGPVKFKPQGGPRKTWIVELTLRFVPKPLAELSRPPSDGGNPVLQVATDQSELAVRSRIRIFTEDDWRILERSWDPAEIREQQLEALAKFSAPLSGSLKVFERQRSKPLGRMASAGWAWYVNRGARDIHQADPDVDHGPDFLERFKSGKALASRAGEKRTLEYDLTIGPKSTSTSATLALSGNKIAGVKTFTYERRANPWRQLMEVSLEAFPGLGNTDERVLALDSRYLARIGVPLMRIARQRDGVDALAELVSFFGYVLRLLLGIHIWTFRQPDKWTETGNDTRILPEINLPGMPGQRVPVTVPMIEPDFGDGTDQQGSVLLTRYTPASVTKPRPVVMFHGYSAGGTTFSHHAVNPSFARYLYDRGYDVWVADLRTSSGHPLSAKMGWSFDQVGAEDVPAIIDKVIDLTKKSQVDVIAHCMGAVVFGMAALGDPGKLDGKVNRAAFTQVAPLVVFSPANIVRAYVLRYLVEFLPENYSFNPKETLAEDLLDRVLMTLPYPIEEFDLENPPGFFHRKDRTPWTRTRHRMDALYGRDFSLVHMDKNLLRFIDEHFGSVHLRTVTQTLHFVRWSMMTNRHGRNTYISRRTLGSPRWAFPTFSVHGTDNGLSHVATMDRMAKILKDAGKTYDTPFYNDGAGHQDALIGDTRLATFARVEKFLTDTLSASSGPPDTEITAYPPWLGPVITEERPKTPLLVIRVGSMPSHREVQAALMLRVVVFGDQVLRPDLQPWDAAYISDHAAAYASQKLRDEGWDAFEVPAPTSFPGYTPGDPIGDGVLVLLTYAEDKSLPAAFAVGYFYQEDGALWTVDVLRQRPPVRFGGQAEYERFQKMVTGALEAIQVSLAPRRGVRQTQPQLKFLGLRSATVGAISGVGATTTPLAPLTTAALEFGVDTAAGVAALNELTEHDRHLMDGVIPYDPPPASLAAPSADGTSFALASCQYPAGLIDGRAAYRGYERITARVDAGTGGIVPRFLVFAGDQVYVDPTAGLYDPSSTDDRYGRPYEDWLGHPSVRNALRRIPSFMLLDDHEIADNWEPPDDGALAAKGTVAYEKYQRGLHPAHDKFDFDGFRFFLLNTRTGRSARKVGGAAGTLIQPAKMAALQSWLQSEPGPKFVVTPSMLLPRHRRAIQHDARLASDNVSALHSDGWDGYPETLREVLGFIAQHGISQVVFLSGDEHRGCIASIELRNSVGTVLARVHSIHTAAMYAPFPFANSLDEDIVPSESFAVSAGATTYTCVVNAIRPPGGDGPTFLRVRQDFGTWRLDYEYPDGAVQTLAL